MSRTKLDKIFDNKFHETDYIHDNTSIDFQSDPFIKRDVYPYRQILIENITRDIDLIITEEFYEFKEVIANKVKRVNKVDINRVYSVVRKLLLKNYTVIDIWYYLASYFDIDTNRFFDSLDDRYKNELVLYLKTNSKLLDDDEINDIF